jgi:hypothetical protein
MSAGRLWLLILCGLVLQQLLPALSTNDGGTATTSAAWEEARALGVAHESNQSLAW